MSSKTNRNLQAKAEKSKRQRREAAHLETTKAPYLFERKSDMRRTAALVAALAAHF